jgi:mannitol-1-phosphate 5-dehydrogenase
VVQKKILQFGAGNIGRSFIGQLFSKAGYEVVFADVDESLIRALNAKRAYTVEIRDRVNASIHIQNVRAIHCNDADAVVREMTEAEICATAVGPQVLPKLFPVMARGLSGRRSAGKGPLDFILCENLRDAARITREGLVKELSENFPLKTCAGLVETSIGKMVPIIPEKIRQADPLTVYAEAYNTLIVDRKGFLNGVPPVPGLSAKENMKAYVDRKSFIHNLGHAALAYFAHMVEPAMVYTYEAVRDPELRTWVKSAMQESGRLLILMYPGEFDAVAQEEHIDDLLQRFGNEALGDTIFRVGRDLGRKLSAGDRVVAPLLENEKRGLPAPYTMMALACGLFFLPQDQEGRIHEPDRAVVEGAKLSGPEKILTGVCGLTGSLQTFISRAYRSIARESRPNGITREIFGKTIRGLNPHETI